MTDAVVIDTETTGFVAGKDRVLQIGAVVLSADGSGDIHYSQYLDPGLTYLPGFHVHRITPAQLQHAPPFERVAPWLHKLVAGRTLVGHNLSYDLRMLQGELDLVGLPPLNPSSTVCTLDMARRFIPGLPNRRLLTCCRRLSIPLSNAHDALADATATAELYRKLMVRQAQGDCEVPLCDAPPPRRGRAA